LYAISAPAASASGAETISKRSAGGVMRSRLCASEKNEKTVSIGCGTNCSDSKVRTPPVRFDPGATAAIIARSRLGCFQTKPAFSAAAGVRVGSR